MFAGLVQSIVKKEARSRGLALDYVLFYFQDVEGVVCVNPGLTARPNSATGGSYARLVFSSRPSAGAMETEEPLRGRVTIHGEVVQL